MPAQEHRARRWLDRIDRIVFGDDVRDIMGAAGDRHMGNDERLRVDLVVEGN